MLSEEVISSETKSTDTWADPEYADAYVGITNTSTFDALVMFSKDLIKTRGESMLGSLFYVLQELLRLSAEARHLIARHGCNSPQTKIYADNILDYVRLVQKPSHQFHAFAEACRSGVAAIIPGSGSENCSCLESVFRKSLDNKQFWELEDDFTERHVLIAAVSKVGLADRVAQCIQ